MEGLPFLPGNTFRDPTQQKYHVSQTLGYKNGYSTYLRPGARPEIGQRHHASQSVNYQNGYTTHVRSEDGYTTHTRTEVALGGGGLHPNQLSQSDLNHLANFNPTLTYGQAKQAPPEDFIPAYVAWDKKVLKFNAYYKQTVHESPAEYYRVRKVDIYYYLEDDSIAVSEPFVDNSGMPQGTLIKRQRLPKNDRGDNWHWKDLNLGTNVTFYGKVFRITDCDKFTSDFLESEGVVVNPPETAPDDPYIAERKVREALRKYKTPPAFDKLKQFLELDRKVLRFFCKWDDRINMFGENRQFVLHYYLVDDSLEVRECRQPNDGRDPFPVLIGRQRVPKDRSDVPSAFPLVAMELSDKEVKEYITPRDLMVGKTVTIYGRKFLLYDCDNFTKGFYYQHFGITDFTTVDVSDEDKQLPKMEIPPFNGYGTLEDSLQSCLSLVPQPPKKDFVKMLDNNNRVLRFEATLDSVKAEDRGRRFIIIYRLADDMLTIYEPPVRNSGIIGGKFLQCTRAAKPTSTFQNPDYYGPQDFHIGAVVEIFSHRFVITGADAFVLDFMEKNAHQFPPATINSLKETVAQPRSAGTDAQNATSLKVQRAPGDLEQLVKQVQLQLKKIAIMDRPRVDAMFLRYDKDRKGHIGLDNMRDLCRQLHLPVDEDVLTALVQGCSSGRDGRISLEDFRKFVESS